jgi:hypothetical protein
MAEDTIFPEEKWDYSGGPVPDSHGVPFSSAFAEPEWFLIFDQD